MIKIMHVPKTGGTSMWTAVKHSGIAAYHRDMLLGYPEPTKLKYLQSHYITWDEIDKARYGVVLRDPADWLASVYNHTADRLPAWRAHYSFEEWYNSNDRDPTLRTTVSRNRMAAYLGRFAGSQRVADIERMLRSIWWVSTTEHLDEDWAVVASALGIPATLGRERAAGGYDIIEDHKTGVYYTLTDDMRDRIYEDNKRDCKLYGIALELRRRNADTLDKRH